MTLVLSIQPYYAGVDDSLTDYPIGETITIDMDGEYDPTKPVALIERCLKDCLKDGVITTGMNVSACLWDELCNAKMEDVSRVLVWTSMAVANLHSPDSAWW